MKKIDAGLLPVTENDKLVGMITDRDIAIRAVAEGKGPDAKVRDAMSPEVKYCFEDEDVTHVAENMAELQVRRLPVMNRDRRLVVSSRSLILRSKVHCRKQQRRCTAFRNRAANTTRVGRVLNSHGYAPAVRLANNKLKPSCVKFEGFSLRPLCAGAEIPR
jgi:CBS domain-containing protein